MIKSIFSIALLIINLNLYSQGRYYKAQMHCHTTNSDGGYSPLQLVNKYKNAGYEIIMITDHNFLTDSINVPGVLCIPSEEITFKRHMNGFFLSRVIMPTPNFTCQQAIDSVLVQGGLIQLNHYCPGPFTDDDWEVSASEIISFENGPHFLEIWNTGTEAIQTHDDKSIWDAVLTAGKRVWGSATDDFHPAVLESAEFNKGWNMIWLDTLTREAVYNALLNGQFYASTGVNITNFNVTDYINYKVISISSSNANKIKFWGPGHVIIQEVNGSSASFILQNHAYVRIELIKEGFFGTGKTYAWTQPIFFENTTSIQQTSDIVKLIIYPNPNNGFANISVKNNVSGLAKLYITNLKGQIVNNIFNDFLNANQHIFKVHIENLPTGFYILTMEINNSTKTLLFKKI